MKTMLRFLTLIITMGFIGSVFADSHMDKVTSSLPDSPEKQTLDDVKQHMDGDHDQDDMDDDDDGDNDDMDDENDEA